MGVGKEAFRLAVTERPGYWQTRVMLENTAALRFWRSAIASVSGGEFRKSFVKMMTWTCILLHIKSNK
jgi:predicted acetyltransferase